MLNVTHNAPLRPLNTMGVNGIVDTLVEWNTLAELETFFTSPDYASARLGTVKQIGEGSNLLFLDDDVKATILLSRYKLKEIVAETSTEVLYRVGAGVKLDDLIEVTTAQGLWGLENLSLIPGTVGAAAVQNVGAYGREFGDVMVDAKCYDVLSGMFVTIGHDEVNYAYRDSIFKHEPTRSNLIVTDVTIRLSPTPAPCLSHRRLQERVGESVNSPADIRKAVIDIRDSMLPRVGVTGSAGSFFKNPVVSGSHLDCLRQLAAVNGIDTDGMPVFVVGNDRLKLSAAWLIDRAGWKNVARGNVATWHSQPLVIVNNTGKATGREIAEFAARIADDVKLKFGVLLTPEVEYV